MGHRPHLRYARTLERRAGATRDTELYGTILGLARQGREVVAHLGVDEKAIAIAKPATGHTFRHYSPTHPLEDGYDLSACDAQAGIRTVQELLRHRDVSTTMVYTHVLNRGDRGVRSPADELGMSPDCLRP